MCDTGSVCATGPSGVMYFCGGQCCAHPDQCIHELTSNGTSERMACCPRARVARAATHHWVPNLRAGDGVSSRAAICMDREALVHVLQQDCILAASKLCPFSLCSSLDIFETGPIDEVRACWCSRHQLLLRRHVLQLLHRELLASHERQPTLLCAITQVPTNCSWPYCRL